MNDLGIWNPVSQYKRAEGISFIFGPKPLWPRLDPHFLNK